ncbi:MAG: hypothetical protein EA401_02435 [Planctomycetota bacterium]|nr:MAG: hypothetical protein EA401_02435 [Planctomycetota bacterium]
MIFAVVTLLLWTGSAYSSSRVARLIGSLRGNRARLLLALPPLLALSLLAGNGPGLSAWQWFALGGILHLGLGDMCLFAAYRRLGPRLALLLCLCLIAPMAGVLEWVWLGERPGWLPSFFGLLVLAAVAFALAPSERRQLPQGAWWPGIMAAVLAAVGQALGAVVTRQGYQVQPDAGALDAAWWRVLGGAVVLCVVVALWRPPVAQQVQQRQCRPWLLWSVLLGPCFGMPAYHAALAVTPAALVQAVLAALPLTVIPLAWWLDGDRPGWRSLVGGVVAVAATAAMILSV